jgi:hypothetical protein
MKLEFSQQIFEKTRILNFIKIRPVGAESFYADGQRDMSKILVFRSFANAPENDIQVCKNKAAAEHTRLKTTRYNIGRLVSHKHLRQKLSSGIDTLDIWRFGQFFYGFSESINILKAKDE